MVKEKLISIIVLNWNGKGDTLTCLESLYNSTYKNFEIILVDNGSSDGSVESFRKLKYPNLKLVLLEKNTGFCGGNIEGLKIAKGDYIVLLNNDIVVDREWLAYLIKAAQKSEKIGVVGGRAYKWGKKNPAYNKANEFFTYQRVDPYTAQAYTLEGNSKPEFVDAISGCAALIKRKLIKEVGFLDAIFFAYYEETDLFARALRAGWKIYYEPQACVWHKVAKSTGEESFFYLYQMARNRALFAIRNFDEPYYSFFKKSYFKEGLRSFGGNLIMFGRNVGTNARAKAFIWVIKNWSNLVKMRKGIVKEGTLYNSNLWLEKDESISIIIPNYNYGKYVEEAIKSALNQTITPKEVIVVDDGSTDDSVLKIKKYPVRLIKQKNQGVVRAKNNGVAVSTGRFVLFLDADDVLKRNSLEEYLKSYKKNKMFGFFYSDMEYFGAKKGLYQSQDFSKNDLKKGNYIHNTSLIKREVFEAAGGYHPSMSEGYEDWDLYISMAEQGHNGKYIPKPLLLYRQHKGGGRNELSQKEAQKLIETVRKRHHFFNSPIYRVLGKIYSRLNMWAYPTKKQLVRKNSLGAKIKEIPISASRILAKIVVFSIKLVRKVFKIIKLILKLRFRDAGEEFFKAWKKLKSILLRRARSSSLKPEG